MNTYRVEPGMNSQKPSGGSNNNAVIMLNKIVTRVETPRRVYSESG